MVRTKRYEPDSHVTNDAEHKVDHMTTKKSHYYMKLDQKNQGKIRKI